MPWKQRGPLSLSGATPAPQAEAAGGWSVQLHVLDPQRGSDAAADALSDLGGAAGVAPDEPALAEWDWEAGGSLFLELASGSDCVVLCKRVAGCPPGRLLLDGAQRLNLHVEHNERYGFKVYEPSGADDLAELQLEARLLQVPAAAEGEDPPALLRLDAREVVSALVSRSMGHALAAGEVIVLQVAGHALRLRVAQADVLDAAARDEAVGYHCFRGVLTPATEVYLHAQQEQGGGGEEAVGSSAGADDTCTTRGGGLELCNCPMRPATVASANRVTVNTSDDELFVVHKSVLRPCIALTAAIRAAGPSGGTSVTVDVGCLVFDRVLLFLEALAQGRAAPEFAITLLDDLAAAARTLGLRSLEDACATRLGEFTTRLREYSFEEIKARNAAGECLLLVDGMVLDVTRWLPEHPGGSTIIPTQALNMDAARFYELYHSSRESFLYVRHFYCGEVRPQDRALVPQPQPGPSDDFLAQLALFTPFRLPVTSVFKSF